MSMFRKRGKSFRKGHRLGQSFLVSSLIRLIIAASLQIFFGCVEMTYAAEVTCNSTFNSNANDPGVNTITSSCSDTTVDWSAGDLTISGSGALNNSGGYASNVAVSGGSVVGSFLNNVPPSNLNITNAAGGNFIILGTSTLDSFINNGSMSGFFNTFNSNSSNVGYIRNNGSMTGGDSGVFIDNTSHVTRLDNYGTVAVTNAFGLGVIVNQLSQIDVIRNFGTLSAPDGVYHIQNTTGLGFAGTIGILINAQGERASVTGDTPVRYNGNLPSIYQVVVNNTEYGKIVFTNPDIPNPSDPQSKMSFGVYSGSTLSKFKQSYASVLSGVSSSLLANTSGTTSGRNWRLIDRGNDTYDLEIDSYFNLINNYKGLTSNRDALLWSSP